MIWLNEEERLFWNLAKVTDLSETYLRIGKHIGFAYVFVQLLCCILAVDGPYFLQNIPVS
jgi:hypothetical protein